MKKEVSTCLAKCNQHVNSTTRFHEWNRCRRSCVTNPDTGEREFFPSDHCNSECDRYWRGTVHWKPCQSQCITLTGGNAPNATPAPHRPNVYNVW
jgi:hypothetical protein